MSGSRQHWEAIERTQRRYRRWVRAGVLLGTAGLVAVILSSSGLRLEWLNHPKQRQAIATPLVTRGAPAVRAKHLDTAVAFPSIKSSISQTPQPLILTGTIVGRSAREGSAFIGVDAHNPQTYGGGALLANGARLTEIYKDHVVLAKGGRTVALYLQQAKGSGGARNTELLIVGGPTAATPAVATSSEPFTDFIRPSPVYDGPTLRGIEVYPGRQAGVFRRLGLQGGDVITALDGQPFSDASQAMEQFRQLASGIGMTATVTRKGQLQTIPLDGSLIVAEQERASAREAATPAGGPQPRPPG